MILGLLRPLRYFTVGFRLTKSCKLVTRRLTLHIPKRPWSDKDNNIYLGSIVAAQQVLDPSPETSHPLKEKGGGGTPAVTKSSGF